MCSSIQHWVGGSFSCCFVPFWNILYRTSLIEVSSVFGEYILHRNCPTSLIEEEKRRPCPSPFSSVACCLNTFHVLFAMTTHLTYSIAPYKCMICQDILMHGGEEILRIAMYRRCCRVPALTQTWQSFPENQINSTKTSVYLQEMINRSYPSLWAGFAWIMMRVPASSWHDWSISMSDPRDDSTAVSLSNTTPVISSYCSIPS